MAITRTASIGSRVPPADDHHADAHEVTRPEHPFDLGDDRRRIGEPSRSEVATGEAPDRGLDDVHAALAQHGDVVGDGGVLPHLGVHRRDRSRPALGWR